MVDQRDTPSALHLLTTRGLIVFEQHNDNSLVIARPASVIGTVFADYEDDDIPTGIDNVSFLSNAPFATITETAKHTSWVVEISEGAAPGPGPIYFKETFDSLIEAANAVIECYFGDRIDFNNASLQSWGLSQS